MKALTVIGLLCIAFAATSCNDSPVVPQKITVTGQVGFDFGYVENAKVEIEGKVTTTDIDGRFTINDVNTPYNVTVMTSNGVEVFVYDNVLTPSPYFNLNGFSQGTRRSFVRIDLDILPTGFQYVEAIFIPEDPNYRAQTLSNLNQGFVMTNISWIGPESIKGKIIVLYFKRVNQVITSYDLYYEKNNVTLYSDFPASYEILPGDPVVDPAETVIKGGFGSGVSGDFRFSFHFENTYGNFISESIDRTNQFSFIVPMDLPVDPVYEVTGNGNSAWGKIRGEPGTVNNIIELHTGSNIISPKENDSVSLSNTGFLWTEGGGNGIYELVLATYTGEIRVLKLYTRSLGATFPDLSNIGFAFTQGSEYHCSVYKLIGFESVNSLVSENYIFNPVFSGGASGSGKKFKLY